MNIKDKEVKLVDKARWLIPGLKIKRWFLLHMFSGSLIVIGFLIIFGVQPINSIMEFIKYVATKVPTTWLAFSMIMLGLGLFCLSWSKTNMSLLIAKDERDYDILESLYRKRKLNNGPKIVAIGGGTGLSMLLKGIKNITNNITAVVTVGDDGGSSGRLRNELGVLPPGDIRNCIAALAKDEDLVTKLFQYRFRNGEGLEGHSFGNLFLSALCSITGDMVRAVKESSNVLSIRGVVLPSTLDDMKLIATMEDGRVVYGESNIPEAHGKIRKIYTDPQKCNALPEVLHAIREADLIILGPGSLYTSVIPNLLIEGISQEIQRSTAKKVYVCNIMTQPGETDGYAVSDHLQALLKHANCNKLVDAVIMNDFIPSNLAQKYRQAGSFPVIIDTENIERMGVKLFSKKLIEDNKDGFVRHSSARVARAINYWYKRQLHGSKHNKKKQPELVKS